MAAPAASTSWGELTSGSAEETFALGERLGRLLEPNDFVGLLGPLGTGKTVFARGVAKGLGVPLEDVSSPTYAIVQTYAGRLALHHADLYRIRDRRELFGTGYFDLLEECAATLVEWLDRVPEAAPPERLELAFTAPSEGVRTLSARAFGARHEALLTAWLGPPRP